MHCWGFDITRADSMNLLVDNREFSQLDSNDGTLLAQKVKQYEDRYVFKLTCHFIDNYICDVVSKKPHCAPGVSNPGQNFQRQNLFVLFTMMQIKLESDKKNICYSASL